MDSELNTAQDEAQLQRLGYRQELRRALSGFSNFAISFSVISILTGGITLYSYGIQTAGPFGVIFGWILVSLASIPIALSMAELASAYPTAGALYHWATFLGNKRWGHFTAWLNYLGQFAITAGIDYGLTEIILSLLGLAPDHVFKFWIYGFILTSHALINHYGIRWIALCNNISVWYHVAAVAILIAVLGYFAPLKPIAFLATTATTTSFPYWYAFCLGLMQAQWTISGYDASAHVSEETIHVSQKVPAGIITSVLSSGVLGLVMLIMITCAISDLPLAMQASNSFVHIMHAALGPSLGSAMVWMCAGAMWFCGLASLTSNSRMLYAFARDGGVPFHKIFASISQKHKTPGPAIWISAFFAFLLALYGKAYAIVTAISTILIFGSYFVPIFLALTSQLQGRWTTTKKGVFQLGHWSIICNGAACAWIAFVTVISFLILHSTFK